jgi:GYF domain 2
VNADNEWRWADPLGQQRLVRTDELRAALAAGVIAPNTPVWKSGWKDWKPAYDVPELTLSALSVANGVVPNIPPPPLFIVAAQHSYEDKAVPPSPQETDAEPPPPPPYVPSQAPPAQAPIATTALPTLVTSQSASPPAHALVPAPSPPLPPIEAKVAPPVEPKDPQAETKPSSPKQPAVMPVADAPEPSSNGSASRVRVATPHATPPPPKPVEERPSFLPPDDAGWDETVPEPRPGVPMARPSETLAGAMRPPKTGDDANTGVDIMALTPSDAERLLAGSGPATATLIHGGGVATVHGVAPIPDPSSPALPPPPPLRASSVPPVHPTERATEAAKSPSQPPGAAKLLTPTYGQGSTVPISVAPRGPSPSGRPQAHRPSKPPPPPPMRKRGQTLMLFGGAPRDSDSSALEAKDADPINVPAPGAQAPKAVTQAPPWNEGSAKLDPAIPKASVPNLPPMRAPLDSIEEITGSVLLAEDSSADVTQRKPKIEDLSDSHVLPADASGPAMQIPPAPLMPVLPAPPPPSQQPGQPSSLGGAHAVAATIPAGPTAGESSSSTAAESPLVPVAQPSPSRRIVHDLTELWAEPQQRWKVALIAGGGAFVALLGLVGLIRLFAGSSSADQGKSPVISAVPSTPSTAEPGASPAADTNATNATNPAPATATTRPTLASTAACVSGSVAHVIAPRAQIRVGVETTVGPTRIGLGFAMTEKEGLAVTLDPTSLTAAGSPSKVHSKEPVRRVVPIWSGKAAAAVIDADRKGETLAGGRSSSDGALLLGAADGKLAWGSRANDTPHTLWPLEGDEPVEALRAVPIPEAGYAVAFRQGASIFVGTTNVDKTPRGALSRVAGLGPQIGSPSIAASADSVIVVWADRAGTTDPWMLRVLHFAPGQPVGTPRAFVIPPGGLGEQAMSPGITSVAGDRFLLAWTEGPVSSHQVRAETLSATGEPLGTPITVSGEGINAGQGQPAVLADGRGLVVYMASPTGSTGQVVATPVSCPLSSP